MIEASTYGNRTLTLLTTDVERMCFSQHARGESYIFVATIDTEHSAELASRIIKEWSTAAARALNGNRRYDWWKVYRSALTGAHRCQVSRAHEPHCWYIDAKHEPHTIITARFQVADDRWENKA